MQPLPPADAPRVTSTFIALTTGTHDKATREAGFGPTRHDLRLLRGFREDCEALPSGALAIEKHLGYRVCGIAGTEPIEMLALYNQIRSHAGTWPAHETACRNRGEQLLFLARHMLDDLGDVADGLDEGGMRDDVMNDVIRRVVERAEEESQHVKEAAAGLLGFSKHIEETLAPHIEEKISISEGTEHDTTNYMQRARLKRMLEDIRKAERAYRRTMDTDEGNILGRRLARTLYGEEACQAHDAVFDALFAYQKAEREVAVPFKVPKSLANRRVQLGYAMLASRSGGQALQHLGLMWETTTNALREAHTAFVAAKDDAGRKAVLATLQPLLEVWGTMGSLGDVLDELNG